MALYTFSIPRAHINQIRSAHTDTLFASTALRVMKANGSLHNDLGAQTVGLNEHKAGGDAFPNLQWVNVDVPDPTHENPDDRLDKTVVEAARQSLVIGQL
jgi:hypothetical protein